MKPVGEKYLALLRRYDTPTVLNAIEQFGVRPHNEGFMGPSIKAMFPQLPPLVGYATTATFRSAEPAAEGDAYSSLPDQVAEFVKSVPAPRVVVFQDLDPEVRGATFGEVMCTVYKTFGCAGLVTSGGARDLEQVEKLGFPCFASCVSPSHAYCRIGGVNTPVDVGGTRVRPGDLIHADCNGVATIPVEIAPEVALACEELAKAEDEVLLYCAEDDPTVDGLRAAYGRCKSRFKEIPSLAGERRRSGR